MKIAKIQSTDASNRIEGIYTSEERVKLIALEKTTPKNRNEYEIAGYRDVLNLIRSSYEHIPLKSSIILQLHRDLYKFNGSNIGGKYKVVDALDEIYSMMSEVKNIDIRGDVYEYLLFKIASAGRNGQFRTPRHIIRMIVELMDPKSDDVIYEIKTRYLIQRYAA